MTSPLDAPIALVGYAADQARALRDLGLLAVAVPTAPLRDVLDAARTLRFAGALVAPAHEDDAFGAATPDAPARKVGRVDAVAFAGGAHGTHTFEDALVSAVEDSGYAVRGATALLVGDGAPLVSALGLARLGLRELLILAPDRPAAERAARTVPHGVRAHAVAHADPAAVAFAQRADLVVIAGTRAALPAGLLQPYHTLLDLGGTYAADAHAAGASSLPIGDLHARHLAARLTHATGQRFTPEALMDAARALQAT
ncbi:hypothetical protein [Deinococcus maricopensis]|uniref:Shikimate dehydrogenase n=1 Tax=Deinococcus maricopensis (strain DSM 21211 / LMG 22137 / NRRL B-23946 / LB-34) TaxID=709986 RepID=E8U821_DEIML|nr:hypothetical protein [Deinococcus maricopensis]ADV67210.1 hypothetical protein Deima_1561 [Deinococcus maricopensis DSM 21211]